MKRLACEGSGRPVNAFPGEEVCPVCRKWIRVTQELTFYRHPEGAETRAARRAERLPATPGGRDFPTWGEVTA